MKVITIRNRPKERQSFDDDLFKQLKDLWQECIKAYLTAAVLTDDIKVDSGMSKGSYLYMARLVKMYSKVRATIRPKSSASKKASGNNLGMPPLTYTKTIAYGERAGREKTLVEYGTAKDPKFLFEFEINVFQYLVNENGRGGTRKPWNSIIKGREAFIAKFRELYPELIDLRDFNWLVAGE